MIFRVIRGVCSREGGEGQEGGGGGGQEGLRRGNQDAPDRQKGAQRPIRVRPSRLKSKTVHLFRKLSIYFDENCPSILTKTVHLF